MKIFSIFCALAIVANLAAGESLAPGLLVTEYPRHVDQIDGSHGYLELEKFGEPIGSSFATESITPWRHTEERNAIARGFLQIDADGDYAFTTNSFYDRNLLMIDGEVVCGYIDGGDKVVTVPLKKGLVEIVSVGFVFGRGGAHVRWRPPGQREISAIPPEKLMHESEGLFAKWLTVVAKGIVVEAYKNGERIPDKKRKSLGASVERIEVEVRNGDWLAFHVVHDRLRDDRTKYFAVAGCLDQNEFGFASDPGSKAWTVCDDPAGVAEFISTPDTNQLRDSALGVERPAQKIAKPWAEGMGLMREHAGADFDGKPLWGKSSSTWIKFVAGEPRSLRITANPAPAAAGSELAIFNPKRWPVHILSASYAAGGKSADVTARVKELVEQKRAAFTVNPADLGADPNPGLDKSLAISYFKDGVQRKRQHDENERLLAESFYGPHDAAELSKWLLGTRWRGPKGDIQFQEGGMLTGWGARRGAGWKVTSATRLNFVWPKEEAIEFNFDGVWSKFSAANNAKNVYRIVN